eukprot:16242_5
MRNSSTDKGGRTPDHLAHCGAPHSDAEEPSWRFLGLHRPAGERQGAFCEELHGRPRQTPSRPFRSATTSPFQRHPGLSWQPRQTRRSALV